MPYVLGEKPENDSRWDPSGADGGALTMPSAAEQRTGLCTRRRRGVGGDEH